MRSSSIVPRLHPRTSLPGAFLLAAALVAGCSSSDDTVVAGKPTNLTIAAPDGTNAPVGADIGPFAVKVTDSAGTVVQNITVTFVASAGLTLTHTTAVTDVAGVAFVAGTFSHQAGNRTVTATVDGIATPVVFHTLAVPDAATQLTLGGGNNQSGAVNTALSEPLSVTVTDQYGNPIPGVTVGFTAPRGTIGTPQPRTDASGLASTTFTLPAATGPTVVTATASINGQNMTILFTETSN